MAAKTAKNKQISEEKPKSINEAFEALDDLIERMQEEDISLEDSFKEYKRGLELVRFCNESISKIEAELEELGVEGNDEEEEE